MKASIALALALFTTSSALAASQECSVVFNPKKPGLFAIVFGSRTRNQVAPMSETPKKDNTDARLRVSTRGTADNGEIGEGLLPRGSALITSSGELAKSGIISIIHAATGAMTKEGGHYEPTLESVKLSVANSISLAERFGHDRIAIPLIGGGIFLQRLGLQPAELAAEIIKSARDASTMIEVRFVAFAEADVQAFRDGMRLVERENYKGLDGMEINQGSITDFNVHGARVIVNAANTEVIFGGGLSGVIAKATQNADAINAEAAAVITSLGR